MFRLIIAFFILTLTLSFSSSAQTREVPKDWKEIRECGVSFLAPKNMNKKRNEVIPIDSYFASYKSSTMTLGLDNDNYMRQPEETSYELLEIDGKKARLVTEPKHLRLYIMSGEGDNARFYFGMGISIKKAADAQTARQIYQSIRFLEK